MADRPWFVRRGISVRAHGRGGWIVTLAYTAILLLIAWIVFGGPTPPPGWLVAIWAVLNFGSAIAFTIIAWRMAVPIDERGDQSNGGE